MHPVMKETSHRLQLVNEVKNIWKVNGTRSVQISITGFTVASKVCKFENKSTPAGHEVINFVVNSCDFVIKETQKVVTTKENRSK